MLFRTHTPAAPLDALVVDFWLYDAYAQPHAMERILPSGTFELVINLRDDVLRVHTAQGLRTLRGAIVSGAFTRPFLTDTLQEASMIGVHFKPAGAAAFLGIPSIELLDTHIELAELWGAFAHELRERLCRASIDERFAILERALFARFTHPPHRAIAPALRMLAKSRVRDAAAEIGIGERRLHDLFRDEVGLAPKVFARIDRFHRAMEQQSDDWSRVAAECGYYDQAHLIRDFAQFAGMTPAAWAKHRATLIANGVHLKRHHLPLTTSDFSNHRA